jgi:hypothetical protein
MKLIQSRKIMGTFFMDFLQSHKLNVIFKMLTYLKLLCEKKFIAR